MKKPILIVVFSLLAVVAFPQSAKEEALTRIAMRKQQDSIKLAKQKQQADSIENFKALKKEIIANCRKKSIFPFNAVRQADSLYSIAGTEDMILYKPMLAKNITQKGNDILKNTFALNKQFTVVLYHNREFFLNQLISGYELHIFEFLEMGNDLKLNFYIPNLGLKGKNPNIITSNELLTKLESIPPNKYIAIKFIMVNDRNDVLYQYHESELSLNAKMISVQQLSD